MICTMIMAHGIQIQCQALNCNFQSNNSFFAQDGWQAKQRFPGGPPSNRVGCWSRNCIISFFPRKILLATVGKELGDGSGTSRGCKVPGPSGIMVEGAKQQKKKKKWLLSTISWLKRPSPPLNFFPPSRFLQPMMKEIKEKFQRGSWQETI